LSVVGEDVQFCARGEAGFSVRLRTRTLARLKVSLAGAHQAANAATALAAVDALRVYGVQVSVEAMRAGLSAMIWPGRGERIGRAPAYLLDGAQNEASARALAALTQEVFPKRRVVLVFGASEDKDIAGMLGVLSPCAQAVILTRSRNPRAAPVEMLEEKVPAACRAWVEKSRGVAQALTRARLRAAKNDVIVVTGSLFVVGEARALLRRAYAL
jgi:dihydrofolate synthase/folylpolyglutamate synthase